MNPRMSPRRFIAEAGNEIGAFGESDPQAAFGSRARRSVTANLEQDL